MHMNDAIRPTVTVVNRNVMDPRGIKNAEVYRSTQWVSAWATAVTKLYMKPKAFKCDSFKK